MRGLIFILIVVWAAAVRGQDVGVGSGAARGQDIGGGGLSSGTGGGQMAAIEKIKITDLESYIAHSDHPLIINFWATFCVPCVKEIPYFESAVRQFKDQKVELLLVSLDLPVYYPARIAGFVQKSGFGSRILWLNETDADYFCPKVDARWTGGIPSSLFINNATHYRRFFDRQLTELQVGPEIKKMISSQP
jgi:thiol-disulfide isomerase/thioredoxin